MIRAIIIIIVIFGLMQFIRPEKVEYIENSKKELKTDLETMQVLKQACYDCHSNSINYPWYSHIAPFSWVIANHTNEGVKALNFSLWEDYTASEKSDKLKSIYRTVYASMPLPSYMWAHKDAQLTKEQREKIRDWTGVRSR
ncbi:MULTISPECIES: heme-binding domain-containing protein [Arcobacteraceae]|uniref:Heme-binding domain-containing protein n=2 Tax=Arcobacteraceae TaxID=2808963 RepID=A0A1C0B1G5_9BACT|nr:MULTISPECIES: heme-binding domain-containing protein [Arcobacteraceae]OCL83007.1 hypothetical protein AAW30_01076 [Arcobacter porcinus]OCL88905.1 hypothetical protein AAX30_00029 [Arcobacter porcinus]OCL89889.1 hypothetical protein AAX27_01704 [Aliarcobacter thereius]OCL93653.1 hypothetical protein AAX28_01204 [Arcobacter porcinus]OCL94601.1 hypothetical protein AA347_00032 [Aliarcobacter thereius LMG 24486]